MNYLSRVMTEPTPQSEALDERQVRNSAGGYSYSVDDMARLDRFLVLGSEGGSYYAGERQLTLENAEAVRRCAQHHGAATVERISDVLLSGRAPKVGPPLFALAVCAAHEDEATRKQALGLVPRLARTGSHLMQFVEYAGSLRGWGRGLRNAVRDWYLERDPQQVAYQVVKYRQRHGWTHRDLLRKSHALVAHENTGLREIFQWVTHGDLPAETDATRLVHAFEEAKTADVDTLAGLIREHRMSWEMVPPHMMGEREVWEALSGDMPLMAMVRNLATLTRVGVISPMRCERAISAIGRIGRDGAPRIHPIGALSALLTYRSGQGQQGQHTWEPVPQVVDALDAAFERSFSGAPRTDRRLYLGIDVSGSMSGGQVAGVPGLTPRMAACAMAMAIARREPNHVMRAFAGDPRIRGREPRMEPLDITSRDSLTDAMAKTQALKFGRTDCALPMLDALERRLPVDCFIVLTDSRGPVSGNGDPARALRRHRLEPCIPAKRAAAEMVFNGFSIADPKGGGIVSQGAQEVRGKSRGKRTGNSPRANAHRRFAPLPPASIPRA
jgi:60 kDa SS-A/Ro ribonucleoprotein